MLKRLFVILSCLFFLSGSDEVYTQATKEEVDAIIKQEQNKHPFDRDEYMQIRSVKIAANSSKGSGWGTGILLSHGRILTCNHVISGVDTKIGVMVWDDNKFVKAKVVASDPIKDIAVLETEDKQSGPYVILQPDFKRGQKIWLVGNPLGEDFEVAETHISQIDRFTYDGGYKITLIVYPCDKMNHGYSGGPTFNEFGELIGINEVMFSSDDKVQEIFGNTLGRPPKHYCGSIPIREVLKRWPFLGEN